MSFFDSITSKIKEGIQDAFDGDDDRPQESQQQAEQQSYSQSTDGAQSSAGANRFHSFAPQRSGNNAKWFVDGCGYMWAVSVALEEARESIWILDWWLSPELYLRRPPTENEQYRVDRMLIAAAERGVKVNVIVYKEVSQVLTLASVHTKHALEVHPNIRVFRHPDHTPSAQDLHSDFIAGLKNLSLSPLKLAQLPGKQLESVYGSSDDIVLYWAHHEKLCLVDGELAFMGGLDLCFGRWDTNSHPIADVHPTDVNKALFPGQDFNNARIYDFADVEKWEDNKLDRTKSSRMGWSDLSICLTGPVVEDLRAHFVQRWNFIFKEKYNLPEKGYSLLSLTQDQIPDGYYNADGFNMQPMKEQEKGPEFDALPQQEHYDAPGRHHSGAPRGQFGQFGQHQYEGQDEQRGSSGISVQLVRSCTKWSGGVPLEHSIQNAYIDVIRNSKHFVYIENQFFITATGDEQSPIKNRIGAALVERVVRAYQSGGRYKVIVLMPSVPAFAGDLQADDSLGTRAIMEYQYSSICRGGHSIIEEIEKAGVPNAAEYIRFYNLRNYDRLNIQSSLSNVEQQSGIHYEDARREHDDMVGAGYDGRGEGTGAQYGQPNREYDRYQEAASNVKDSRFDSVSMCYMNDGPSIREIPWSGSEEAEMNAFVSEELYIHSKLLIADDQIVICGSANLNDRSQIGKHDSEIAVIIEDSTPVDSVMNGEQYRASAYASSLRRQLFRKHLGLLPHQECDQPNESFMPVTKDPNVYDWGSPSDQVVADVLSDEFNNLWTQTAAVNTAVFARAFHCVPDNKVTNWEEYESFFSSLFVPKGEEGKDDYVPSRYEYGHVVAEEFPGGVQELKGELERVRGTLVEMPLRFMEGVDFAKEGLSFNAFTNEVYT
ncbi:hypothetical protein BJ875DRAFT_516928 [Amylocarpus encephaloides]|uniref:Phospholipase n=1 Tax=Amylocarpus encephaloides TaxID=45428 RepID=A0A9P7YDI6_9HELO|nr:hypothetical protein BJ875DRAFT_516928 [Amylocarpus encephaloides]